MSVATRILAAVLLFLAPAAWAGEVKPFVAGSMGEIRAAHQGRPFILGLWSLTCTHCQAELALLGALLKRHPALDLVLVSTDSPVEQEAVAATLSKHGLEHAEAWVFADDFVERLRFAIDRKWQGELPRTYLFDATHNIIAYSGKPDPQLLEHWIRAHFKTR